MQVKIARGRFYPLEVVDSFAELRTIITNFIMVFDIMIFEKNVEVYGGIQVWEFATRQDDDDSSVRFMWSNNKEIVVMVAKEIVYSGQLDTRAVMTTIARFDIFSESIRDYINATYGYNYAKLEDCAPDSNYIVHITQEELTAVNYSLSAGEKVLACVGQPTGKNLVEMRLSMNARMKTIWQKSPQWIYFELVGDL